MQSIRKISLLCVADTLRRSGAGLWRCQPGLLLALAIAPAKDHFSQWHSYQQHYLSLIHDRGDAVEPASSFPAWHSSDLAAGSGRRGPLHDLPPGIE